MSKHWHWPFTFVLVTLLTTVSSASAVETKGAATKGPSLDSSHCIDRRSVTRVRLK